MTIGERIKNRREEIGMTQDELAKKCGYKSRSSINKIELSRELPLKKVSLMADALDCSPTYLMGWKDDNSSADIKKVPDKTIRIDLDNGISIIYDPSKEKDVKTAIELYQKFQKTNPDVQSAIELLLKPAKSDT